MSISTIRMNLEKMKGLQEIQKLEELYSDINKEKEKTNDKSHEQNVNTIMFISFDIVNSSIYKSSNYLGWFKVIYALLNHVYDRLVGRIEDIELWRTIGDELVFVVTIYDIKDLATYTQIIYEELIEINKYIKKGGVFHLCEEKNIDELIEQNPLEMKSTAWIARVAEVKSNKDLGESITGNISYFYDSRANISSDRKEHREFQGKDIDAGFRIAKENTVARKLSLSLELAYILSQDNSVHKKIHIVGYNRLKGIWNERPYPIIWYHDVYIAGCEIENSFTYDEDEYNFIVDSYLNRKNSNKIRDCISKESKSELHKIVKDRNLNNKISNIKDSITKSSKIERKPLIADENPEVHCVAVCTNKEKSKVLMFKRADKEIIKFEGLWDFGCAKILGEWTFEEALRTEYKDFANLDIKVGNPFRDYSFKHNNKVISGIRYQAIVNEGSNIKLNSSKYVAYEWVDLDLFDKMEETKSNGKSPFIDYKDFKEIIEIVLEVRGNDKDHGK
ncbi:MAG: hypothetical protein KIB53_06975 [Paraclostridium bifermentans]|uniref:hypothetical protein n=1 Tax=Paraclostridium bifermentans TaxID=1490 RepID=UPI00241CAFDA|nr:hypothetical protein [Paraclostridium bifermentans]MBS5953550.1 hypothetical protein [Paraclostridium bifermentans]